MTAEKRTQNIPQMFEGCKHQGEKQRKGEDDKHQLTKSSKSVAWEVHQQYPLAAI